MQDYSQSGNLRDQATKNWPVSPTESCQGVMFERRVDRLGGLPYGDVPALPGAQRAHERRAGEAAGRVVRLVQVHEVLLRRVEQRVHLSNKQTVSSDFHALRFDGLWTSCPSPIGRPR